MQLGRKRIIWYSENNHFKELNRIYSMQTEFEWKIFPRFTCLDVLEVFQNFIEDIQCEPQQFNDRIIFMSMYNDVVSREKGNTEKCVQNSITIAKYARRFPRGRWCFLGPGTEKKWYGTFSDKPDGHWDRTAEMMMVQLHTESDHPIFSCLQCLCERGIKKQRTW